MSLAVACAPLAAGAPAGGPPAALGSLARPVGEAWVAVVDDAAVDAVVALVREGGRRIGVGAAPPGPGDGPVTLAARRALEAARRRPARLAVRGTDPVAAADAQAVLTALALLLARRSAAAWAAVDLLAGGATRAAAAAALGVSRQAVAQRLAAASWDLEFELRPTAARLLDRAAGRPPG